MARVNIFSFMQNAVNSELIVWANGIGEQSRAVFCVVEIKNEKLDNMNLFACISNFTVSFRNRLLIYSHAQK